MADIDSQQAIVFYRQILRPHARHAVENYYRAKQIIAAWYAWGSAEIPNTTDVILDGAANDGRMPVTGAMANNIVTRALELVADLEASGSAKLNTLLQVACPGLP